MYARIKHWLVPEYNRNAGIKLASLVRNQAGTHFFKYLSLGDLVVLISTTGLLAVEKWYVVGKLLFLPFPIACVTGKALPLFSSNVCGS